MKRKLCGLVGGLALSAGLLAFAGPTDAGGAKGPWQPILSKETYQELCKREADLVRDLLDGKLDEKAVHRAKFGSVLIAAFTMSVKEGVAPNELLTTRNTALKVATDLAKKGQWPDAKKLSAFLPNKAKPDAAAKETPVQWKQYLQVAEIMDPYRVKSKGGDGMHPDLQSNIRLKEALNGVEEKIRALAAKELNAAGLKKEAKELELLGYHTAVVGSLTYHFAPAQKSGKKDPAEWRTLALQMRDHSVGLAIAAQKGDAAALLKASNSLYSTCNQCHTIFK